MNAKTSLAILALLATPTIAFAQSGNGGSPGGNAGAPAAAPRTTGTIGAPDPGRAGLAGRTGKHQMSKAPETSDLPPQPTPNIIRYR